MSLPVSEELLSAYLDGELSPSEHELVDRLLGELPALREQLAELAQVGEKLRGLPREKAPTELRGNVLAAVSSTVSLQPLAASKPIPARDLAKAAGALAACLAVGLSVWLANRPASDPAEGLPGDTVAIQESAKSEFAAHDMVAQAAPMLAAEAAVEAEVAQPASLAANTAGAAGAAMKVAPQAAAARVMKRGAMAAPGEAADQDHDAIRKRLLVPGRVPNAGELLSYLDVVDDEPVVVEYTVADVQSALGQVQVLLSRNGIQATGEAQGPVAIGGDKLVAIYLEANEQELTGVLNEIRSLPLVMMVDQTAPTHSKEHMQGFRQMSQLHESADSALQLRGFADRKKSDSSDVRPPAPPLAELVDGLGIERQEIQRTDNNRVATAGRPAAATAPAAMDRPSFDSRDKGQAQANEKSSGQNSFQIAVPKAAELRSALSTRRAAGQENEAQQSRQGMLKDSVSAKQERMRQPADSQVTQERRRVVIFLQSETLPAASAKPAAPPAEPAEPR